jgi:outer membrane lipoprotein-sorting protein
MKKINLLLFVAILFGAMNFVNAQDANTILKKVDELTSAPKDLYQTATITMTDKAGHKQVRTAEIWQKGTNKRLFKFTSPASQKGIGFLSLPNDIMYIYMPAYAKERRIASSVKNQKFAGTDMTYDDLEAKKYSDKYTPSLIKTENNIFFLKLVPKEKSQYSKVILQVNARTYLPIKAEYYDKGNNKIKVSTFDFQKSGNYYYVKTLIVKDLKTKHSTTMTASDVKFDQNLGDDLFTVRNLKN